MTSKGRLTCLWKVQVRNILTNGSDENVEIVDFKTRTVGYGGNRGFVYRFIKFKYDVKKRLFKPITFKVDMKFDELREKYANSQAVPNEETRNR